MRLNEKCKIHGFLFMICVGVVKPAFNPSRYDKGVTLFAPDGRLNQVEYANIASSKGDSFVCLVTDENSVVVAFPSRKVFALLDRRAIDKVCKIDDTLWLAFSGLAGDGWVMICKARSICQEFRLRFGCPPSVFYVAKKIASIQHSSTLTGGERPYGVKTLVFGWTLGHLTPEIYETRPSGDLQQWRVISIGRDSERLNEELEKSIGEEPLDTSTAIKTIQDVFQRFPSNREEDDGSPHLEYGIYSMEEGNTVKIEVFGDVSDVSQIRRTI